MIYFWANHNYLGKIWAALGIRWAKTDTFGHDKTYSFTGICKFLGSVGRYWAAFPRAHTQE